MHNLASKTTRPPGRSHAVRIVEQLAAALHRGLHQVDEVAASVFEENDDDRADAFWFAAKVTPRALRRLYSESNLIGDEGGGRNASRE